MHTDISDAADLMSLTRRAGVGVGAVAVELSAVVIGHTESSILAHQTVVTTDGVAAVAGSRCVVRVHVARVVAHADGVTVQQNLAFTVSVTVDVVVQTGSACNDYYYTSVTSSTSHAKCTCTMVQYSSKSCYF